MSAPELSIALATLLRGPLHAEDSPPLWRSVTILGAQLHEHLDVLGLRLVVDETEGYAYLRMKDELPDGMPRLFRRHALTYGATVLLILLRQRVTSAEAQEATPRVIVTTAEMTEWTALYRREAKQGIASDIGTLTKLGYLRPLRDSEDTFEVRRIIKALVTIDWMNAWAEKLLGAARSAEGTGDGGQPIDLEAPGEIADGADGPSDHDDSEDDDADDDEEGPA